MGNKFWVLKDDEHSSDSENDLDLQACREFVKDKGQAKKEKATPKKQKKANKTKAREVETSS